MLTVLFLCNKQEPSKFNRISLCVCHRAVCILQACSKLRILHVPNTFKTIDNQLKRLIIHCFECIRRM
jgi:hypothetical protein